MMKKQILETIERYHLLEEHQHIVLGLSGGPDSVCLFHVLLQLAEEMDLHLYPVHVNHKIRPGAAEEDQNYVEQMCERAGVDPRKVFPHNLRHLFARTYYSIEKDLSRLADILGHSNINTTRIYTMESGAVHACQIERLGLTIT